MTLLNEATGEVVDDQGIRAWERRVLGLIGLTSPDPEVPLHVVLVNTVRRLGPGQPDGAYLAALRFDFVWTLRSLDVAGKTVALAHKRARFITKAIADGRREDPPQKVAVSLAEYMADADDDVRMAALSLELAKHEETAMRKFLDAIASALDNHRTDRADARAADKAHAGGFTGGA